MIHSLGGGGNDTFTGQMMGMIHSLGGGGNDTLTGWGRECYIDWVGEGMIH